MDWSSFPSNAYAKYDYDHYDLIDTPPTAHKPKIEFVLEGEGTCEGIQYVTPWEKPEVFPDARCRNSDDYIHEQTGRGGFYGIGTDRGTCQQLCNDDPDCKRFSFEQVLDEDGDPTFQRCIIPNHDCAPRFTANDQYSVIPEDVRLDKLQGGIELAQADYIDDASSNSGIKTLIADNYRCGNGKYHRPTGSWDWGYVYRLPIDHKYRRQNYAAECAFRCHISHNSPAFYLAYGDRCMCCKGSWNSNKQSWHEAATYQINSAKFIHPESSIYIKPSTFAPPLGKAYSFAGDGYCKNYQLPIGATEKVVGNVGSFTVPKRLPRTDVSYDEDPAQECAKRCNKDYGATSFFLVYETNVYVEQIVVWIESIPIPRIGKLRDTNKFLLDIAVRPIMCII